MRSFFAMLMLACALVSSPAIARPHNRHHYAGHHHHSRVLRAGQPAACAGIPWCGCWLKLHLGVRVPGLNLNRAIEWARVGGRAPGPARGVIAVWRNHVGLITEYLGGGKIRLLSGNDGHAVRDRVRSTRGVVAYRKIN